MNDTLEYIDNYFAKKLSDAEKQLFEERCSEDENFAGEVALYITSREAVRQELLKQKKQLWLDSGDDTRKVAATKVSPVRKMNFKRWLPYAAAACLVFAMAVYFFYPADPPQRFAGKYVEQKLTQLSQTMDGATDSLQKGISFYNSGAYDSALALFKNLSQAQPANSAAKEYLGLVYLMKKDYDKALIEFDELAGKKLFSNPGVFLKAITLLKRNKKGDQETAKVFLTQVKDQKLEGRKEAEEWLGKW